ncbi:MAG: hypothetical protein ACP5G4_00420 [bacterium]
MDSAGDRRPSCHSRENGNPEFPPHRWIPDPCFQEDGAGMKEKHRPATS